MEVVVPLQTMGLTGDQEEVVEVVRTSFTLHTFLYAFIGSLAITRFMRNSQAQTKIIKDKNGFKQDYNIDTEMNTDSRMIPTTGFDQRRSNPIGPHQLHPQTPSRLLSAPEPTHFGPIQFYTAKCNQDTSLATAQVAPP